MYDFLKSHSTRPSPHSLYTARELWTDPHVAQQMLALHLDRDGDVASRSHQAIDRIVVWLDQRFGLSSGKRVLDLGCGPGLYANRMAYLGARVTGIDFSEGSIAHAQRTAPNGSVRPLYVVADYLDLELGESFDLILLIYGDLCALSPTQRARLLQSIRSWLAPGGHFAFDTFSTALFDEVEEEARYTFEPDGGFWSPRPHFDFLRRFKYEGSLYLDRHAIVEETHTREVFNWMQCYDVDSLERELGELGWEVTEALGSLAGDPYEAHRHDFAAVARPNERA